MAEFVIKMAHESGRVLQQVEKGQSEAEVRDRFAQQGYLVYWVKPRGLLSVGEIRAPRRKRIKQTEFLVFNQQFVTLFKAGLTIPHALELLGRKQRNEYFAAILKDVRQRVQSGTPLSEAFEAQQVFPKIYTTTLLAGEKSGNLEEVTARYITFQRMAISFRKKLQASLVYPALLFVLVIAMVTFLITYVVPRFADLYEQIGTQTQLPVLTRFMLALGVGAQKYFPFVVIGVAGGIFLLTRWARTEKGAVVLDGARMRLPLLGTIWLRYQVALFARTMATLLGGGQPLVPALETAGQSMTSKSLAIAIEKACQRVREGQALSRSLEETKVFPDLATEMIEVGESTGALPAMLTSVAEFYEEDLQNSLTAAMSLIEPLILLVMGVVVVFVLLSLYLPIFTLGAGGLK